jgi:hypothetical protein
VMTSFNLRRVHRTCDAAYAERNHECGKRVHSFEPPIAGVGPGPKRAQGDQ